MKSSVIKATVLIFFLSLFAKVIGFIKSVIQASYFGTTIETDAFNVANGFVSNILYMFATAIAVAFVPLYIQHKINKDEKRFATLTITSLMVLSGGITVLLLLLAPLISKIIAPNYTGYELSLTNQYLKILVLGFSFALITQLYSNLLNSEKIYGYSTSCSIINSIVLILFIFLFANKLGVWSLVISIPISYFVQWLVLFIRGKQYATISFKYGIWDDTLKVLAIQAFPILLSQATVEINQVVDRALLTSVGEGALTAVSYAAVLYQFVTALVSSPLSTVMFTELSEAGAIGDKDSIKSILNSCYKILFLICIPIVIVMFFTSNDIVNIVYGHGKFTSKAVMNCSAGLKMYGFCLLPVCIKTVLSRAYYAVNNTKSPMVIGMLEVALNIVLSIVLVKPFGILGVVGATALSSIVFIFVMICDYNQKYIKVITKEILFSYWKIVIASIILLVVMCFCSRVFLYNSLMDFIIKTLISFVTFIFSLFILKDQTLDSVIIKGKRFVKSKIKN